MCVLHRFFVISKDLFSLFGKRAKEHESSTWWRSCAVSSMVAMEALMTRITALEEDNARTSAENDELRERVNTLQAGAPGGSNPVDTRLLSKPTEFEGKEGDWIRFSLKMKAYPGAIGPQVQRASEDRRGPRAKS